jgi:hypothetical protein
VETQAVGQQSIARLKAQGVEAIDGLTCERNR